MRRWIGGTCRDHHHVLRTCDRGSSEESLVGDRSNARRPSDSRVVTVFDQSRELQAPTRGDAGTAGRQRYARSRISRGIRGGHRLHRAAACSHAQYGSQQKPNNHGIPRRRNFVNSSARREQLYIQLNSLVDKVGD